MEPARDNAFCVALSVLMELSETADYVQAHLTHGRMDLSMDLVVVGSR